MKKFRGESIASVLVPLLLIAIVMGVGSYLALRWWQVERQLAEKQTAAPAIPLDAPPLVLTDFTLTERSGEPFKSAEMRGKVWVVSYFFTSCPGSCVRLNANIEQLHKEPELADVTWLSVTCDPENDTLEALSVYANSHSADPKRWLFARADMDYIKQVGLAMNLDIYTRSHKAYCVVIDRAGELRGMYDLAGDERDVGRLRERLVELLVEPLPAQ